MALRLQIISDQSRLLGEQAVVVFGPRGGRLGRALDNDWVLPDPNRFLSAHHATFHAVDGRFEVEDTSRNGVYANSEERPIGREQRRLLSDGDVLRLGDYRIRVHIDPIQVLDGLNDALVAVDHVAPVRRDGESIPQRQHANVSWQGAPESVDASEGSSRMLATLDARAGLQAFCRGAGIEADKLRPDSDVRILLLAGQLLRESLLGLRQLVHAQREFQRQLGTPVPVASVTYPAPDAATPADYLLTLLNGEVNGELDAIQVLRAYFDAGERHESALPATLRVALLAFLKHFDPAIFEERAAARGEMTEAWSLYVDLYRNVRQTARGDLPRLFTEALAQAYDKPT